MTPLITILVGAVADALRVAAEDDNVPLPRDAAPEVIAAVVERVQASPAVVSAAAAVAHATNAEPWYRSRVTWGALIGAIAALAPLTGLDLTPEQQQGLVTAGVLLGSGLTLAGRWIARKPMGAR